MMAMMTNVNPVHCALGLPKGTGLEAVSSSTGHLADMDGTKRVVPHVNMKASLSEYFTVDLVA